MGRWLLTTRQHTLPFSEIVSIEKRSTAYVIPNAIQVTTLNSKVSLSLHSSPLSADRW